MLFALRAMSDRVYPFVLQVYDYIARNVTVSWMLAKVYLLWAGGFTNIPPHRIIPIFSCLGIIRMLSGALIRFLISLKWNNMF